MSDNCNTHKSVGVGPGSRVGPTVYNKIERTPSGHQFEVDDTAGNERIRRQHTTGTYEELDATGGRTVEVVGENFTALLSGNTLIVDGVCDITVNGNCNLRVDQTQDPETGEPTGGDLKVEAENIYLNSRKNMELNAGANMSLETRQPKGNEESEEKALGGDIGIISAGHYKLKVQGEAKERFKKSLDTNVDKAYDLTIGGDYEVLISGGATDEKTNETYNGDFIQRCKGQTTLSSREKLKLVSKDKTIIAANDDVKVKTEKELNFNSTKDTIFNSDNLTVESGPVHIVEEVNTDDKITAQKKIKSEEEVQAKTVKLTKHKHLADGRPKTPQPTSEPLI